GNGTQHRHFTERLKIRKKIKNYGKMPIQSRRSVKCLGCIAIKFIISFQRVYSILCRLDGINVLQKTAFIVGMRASPTTKWWEKLIWKKGASNYGIYRKTKKEILCGLYI